MNKIIVMLSAFFISGINQTFAQGCSNAGICSIHAIKNNTEKAGEKDTLNNEISVNFSFGKGERNISYYTTDVEYTRSLSNSTSVTGKISYGFIAGELASTNGFGDLFFSVNHAFHIKKKWQKSFTIGVKIPFDKAELSKNEIELPMPYQTSLGTTDLVLGLNFIRKSLGITVGLQQPLKPTNGNGFLPEDYISNKQTARYLPTNKFVRKGDVLLRASYNYKVAEKLFIRPSLLFIYHETNDTYLDVDNVRKEIARSKGLTFNVNAFVEYELTKRSGLELSLGTPLVIRNSRPDGLTRSFVAALDYKFSF